LGTPFVFFNLAMVMLPNINAAFMSKLVPAEVIGWYSVSQRLVGLLLFPAGALIGALYPTLCRLHGTNADEFARVTRGALYSVALLAIPAAVGCGFFPEVGVAIFGTQKYAGAIAHLRVMAAFIFLVYFSMPLGTAVMSANRQKEWAAVQCICIVVALIANPLLIPWFQRHTGNGATGTCVALVISEVLVVACGAWLLPRGVIDRSMLKSVTLSMLAGAAMAVVAYFGKRVSIFLALPASFATYATLAWVSGAVQPSTAAMLKGFVARKLARLLPTR
jgi:O-antigen/teichoic acid export membrane protein